MAGLLGDGWGDPQSMATLALASGLLSPGSFGQGLGKGLQGYQGTMMNAQDMQLKQQQIAAAQQEQQLRDVAIRQAQAKLKLGQWFGSGLSPASADAGVPPQSPASAALASGAQAGSVGPTVANAQRMDSAPPAAPITLTPTAQSRLASLTQDQIAAGVVSGALPKELVELWTNAKFGRALPPGWKQGLDGSMTYVPDPTKGLTMGPDGKTVVAMPGAADAQAGIAAATTTAQERAKNAQTPVPLDRLDRGGVPGMGPASSIDELLHPAPPPTGLGGFSPSGQAAIAADMRRNGLTTATAQTRLAPGDAPISLAPTAPAGAPPPGAFKSAADIAADAERQKLVAAQPINFQTKVLTDAHTNNQKTLSDLADITNNEAEIVSRNQRVAPYITKLNNAGGWGYDQRVTFANNLKNSGFPMSDSISKWVAGGDPADAKTVQNQLAAAAIQTMLDTLDKEGKPNRAIFQAVEAEKEALANGKDVLANVMDLQSKLYQQHVTQLGSMTDLMSSPDYNPVKFQYQFATHKKAAIDAGGAAPSAESAAAAAPVAAPAVFKMLPPASQFAGKKMKSDDGTIYKSDGKTWTKQ